MHRAHLVRQAPNAAGAWVLPARHQGNRVAKTPVSRPLASHNAMTEA
jgi:hypothetical protein